MFGMFGTCLLQLLMIVCLKLPEKSKYLIGAFAIQFQLFIFLIYFNCYITVNGEGISVLKDKSHQQYITDKDINYLKSNEEKRNCFWIQKFVIIEGVNVTTQCPLEFNLNLNPRLTEMMKKRKVQTTNNMRSSITLEPFSDYPFQLLYPEQHQPQQQQHHHVESLVMAEPFVNDNGLITFNILEQLQLQQTTMDDNNNNNKEEIEITTENEQLQFNIEQQQQYQQKNNKQQSQEQHKDHQPLEKLKKLEKLQELQLLLPATIQLQPEIEEPPKKHIKRKRYKQKNKRKKVKKKKKKKKKQQQQQQQQNNMKRKKKRKENKKKKKKKKKKFKRKKNKRKPITSQIPQILLTAKPTNHYIYEEFDETELFPSPNLLKTIKHALYQNYIFNKKKKQFYYKHLQHVLYPFVKFIAFFTILNPFTLAVFLFTLLSPFVFGFLGFVGLSLLIKPLLTLFFGYKKKISLINQQQQWQQHRYRYRQRQRQRQRQYEQLKWKLLREKQRNEFLKYNNNKKNNNYNNNNSNNNKPDQPIVIHKHYYPMQAKSASSSAVRPNHLTMNQRLHQQKKNHITKRYVNYQYNPILPQVKSKLQDASIMHILKYIEKYRD